MARYSGGGGGGRGYGGRGRGGHRGGGGKSSSTALDFLSLILKQAGPAATPHVSRTAVGSPRATVTDMAFAFRN